MRTEAQKERRELAQKKLVGDSTTCAILKTMGECSAHDSCAWCQCPHGAAKDACWSLEDAKKLPGDIFQCEKMKELPASVNWNE